jgi:ATP-dependent Lhr-like helicase
VVWVGRGAAGPTDGRVALYRRELVADLLDPVESADPDGPLHRVLLGHLARRGACFLMELAQAAEAAEPGVRREDFEAALWDLVWAGCVTNDTFAPLRALGAGRSNARGAGRAGGIAGGRWSLVADRTPAATISSGQSGLVLAQARMLLERYGVVSREAVQAEAMRGGFVSLYRVLKQMEEAGRVQRGWFVEGLSGAQFALAGALDRLRAARQDEVPIDGYGPDQVCTLAAIDPANPYGALVPWPSAAGGGTPRRVSGAWVVLVAGAPVVYVAPGGRQILTFPHSCTNHGGELALALAALHRLPDRRRLAIRAVDGTAATQSRLREAVIAAGFLLDYDALVPAGWAKG